MDAQAVEAFGRGNLVGGICMRRVDRILVIQTAFLGDVILTLPLLQQLKEFFADSEIDIVVVPRAADICRNHPAVHEIISYDKRGAGKGVKGIWRLGGLLRNKRYDLAVVPHRSLRSAILAFLARAPMRIGFTRSAGFLLFTKRVRYEKDEHEIERNLSLLSGIGIEELGRVLPHMYPGEEDVAFVSAFLKDRGIDPQVPMIAIAPGTIWNTKRWLKERFAELSITLNSEGYQVLLIGGREDIGLCREIVDLAGSDKTHSTAGELLLLQSAEAIRRCGVMISNDSAPMHIAVAMGTPVVAIFGATVPAFGFAPYGPHDMVVETRGLRCRPCSIHGGEQCPIKTFECMKDISADKVLARVQEILKKEKI